MRYAQLLQKCALCGRANSVEDILSSIRCDNNLTYFWAIIIIIHRCRQSEYEIRWIPTRLNGFLKVRRLSISSAATVLTVSLLVSGAEFSAELNTFIAEGVN